MFSSLLPCGLATASDWMEPFSHLHESPQGTPIVHAFNIEPAVTGRDLFATYRYRSGDEAIEQEMELELECALTKRLGFIVEAPWSAESERGGPRVDGFGDLALVPRALVYESDRFLLTAQTEITLPTASDDLEASTAIAPGLVAWLDLGGWWTLCSAAAIEHNFDEDGTEAVFGFGLIKSFHRDHEGHHHHASASGLNLHLEVTGTVGLNGEEDGDVGAEALIGMSYGLCNGIDIRLGHEFALTSPEEFEEGWVGGLVFHF